MSRPKSPLAADWTPLLERALEALVAEDPVIATHAEAADVRGASFARLARLLDLVVLWNSRTDLTAARDPRELCDLYFADALLLAAHGASPQHASRWIDVGSGAGAPGLVLGVLRPELPLTLVEPRLKRVAFLRTAVGTLGLSHVTVLERRSDAIAAGAAEVAVSRATFSPEEWLREGARLATRSVWVLLARGAAPEHAGFRLAREVRYHWPLTGVERRALEFVPERA